MVDYKIVFQCLAPQERSYGRYGNMLIGKLHRSAHLVDYKIVFQCLAP